MTSNLSFQAQKIFKIDFGFTSLQYGCRFPNKSEHNNFTDIVESGCIAMPVIPAKVMATGTEVYTMLVLEQVVWLCRLPVSVT